MKVDVTYIFQTRNVFLSSALISFQKKSAITKKHGFFLIYEIVDISFLIEHEILGQ